MATHLTPDNGIYFNTGAILQRGVTVMQRNSSTAFCLFFFFLRSFNENNNLEQKFWSFVLGHIPF